MPLDTNSTKLANLFNPQVVGDLIRKKLVNAIRFSPLAFTDVTLMGHPGDTVTLPSFNYIGDAEDVEEGAGIPISKLTMSTTTVQIKKAGKGVSLSDEAVLSGYGQPLEQAVNQLITSIAQKVDNDLLTALDAITGNMLYTASGRATADDISDALIKFEEDLDGDKVFLTSPETYGVLRKVDEWIPASEIAAAMLLNGSVGMIHGCQVVVSNKLSAKNASFIVKRGALGLFLKRDVLVETDRDIVHKATILTADQHYAAYLYDTTKAIKIVETVASTPSTGSAKLSALSIGSLSLTPEFSADTTSYTAATSNATNTVTATPEDSAATVVIKNGDTTVTNGSAATWASGENTLTVTVTNGGEEKVYTVVVTKNA